MANETVELYYKGKPINPNRDLPTRTYAEAQAEGLTSSDKLWVRNDAPQSDLIVDNLTTDDSARALSAKQGKVLNDKIGALIYSKVIQHNYSVGANGNTHWNPTADTGFSVSGYTPIGIIGVVTNNVNVLPIHFREENSDWAMALRNVSGSDQTGSCIYKVLYVKN